MFIEMRSYTFLPGRLARFYELQAQRGFDVVRPIMERLVCYLGVSRPESDLLVHLWRYDSHEDRNARLHGLYGRPEIDAYVQTVRALMIRQDTAVLVPAPIASLTPVLGNGNDWLPSAGPRLGGYDAIEMDTVDFTPGAVPSFWARLRETDLKPDPGLLGVFLTETGPLHRVIAFRAGGRSAPEWEHALEALSSSVVARRRDEMHIAPIDAMAPIAKAQ